MYEDQKQENEQEDKIVVQCVTCGRVRYKLSDWSEKKREQDPSISKVICPNCSPGASKEEK